VFEKTNTEFANFGDPSQGLGHVGWKGKEPVN
jgi:hypothetical protein